MKTNQLRTLWVYNNQDKETYKVCDFPNAEGTPLFDFQIKYAIIDELINNLGIDLDREDLNLLRKATELNKVKTEDKIYVSIDTEFARAALSMDNAELKEMVNGTFNMGFEEDKVFFLQ